jgi:hypothetical protein
MIVENILFFPEGTFIRVSGTRDGVGLRRIENVSQNSFVAMKYHCKLAGGRTVRYPRWEEIKERNINISEMVASDQITTNAFDKVTHVFYTGQIQRWMTVEDYIRESNSNKSQ